MSVNNINRKVYKKSFLKSIQSVFSFEPINWTVGLKNDIERLLENESFKITKTGDMPLVQSNKGTIVIVVTDKGVVLSTDVKDYVDFGSFSHYFDLVRQIMQTLGCSELKNFVFQKHNTYKLGKSEKRNFNQQTVYKALFSENVINQPVAFLKEIDNCIYTAQPSYKEETDFVVAQLVVSAIWMGKLPVENLPDVIKNINDNLFGIWYESTSEGIHKIMEQE